MAQIFDPVPSEYSDQIVCCYINATSKIQIARITNIPNWYFERVVFPGQRLIFEALPEAQLEIHCGMMASAILSDTIPCDRLQLEDEMDASVEAGDAEDDKPPQVSDSLSLPKALTQSATLSPNSFARNTVYVSG